MEYTLFSDIATGPAGARRLQLSKWVAFSCSKAVPTGHSLSLVPWADLRTTLRRSGSWTAWSAVVRWQVRSAIFVTRGIWLTGWAWYCLVVTSASKLSLRIAWGNSSMCSHRLEGHLWDMCHSGSHNDGGIGRDPWHIDPWCRSSWSSLAQMMVHFSGQSALLKLFLVIRYLRHPQTNCDRWPLQLGRCEIYVPDLFCWSHGEEKTSLNGKTHFCDWNDFLGVWELWTSYFISVHLENRN